jgi:hypothetical protein
MITEDSADPNKFNRKVFDHAKVCPENEKISDDSYYVTFDLDDEERGNIC